MKKHVANLKPAFSTDQRSVYNTDCMKLLAAIKDGQIDTVFADPPFNLPRTTATARTKMTWRTATI